MRQLKDKKAVCKLLKEAILQLCRVSVGLHGNFNIDGIICIGHGENEDHEVVVKIHEKVRDKQNSDSIPVSQTFDCGKKPVNFEQYSQGNSQNITESSNSQPKQFYTEQRKITAGKQLLDIDNDVEILDISADKHLFGEIDNFSDIECMGYDFDDLSFSDVVIKPDPGSLGKTVRGGAISHNDEESSDEELKIETLKAGRVRKPHKGSYRDVHGAPVQVLSKEEFKRILKSEKLKRSRDKSPDFVSAQKVLKTASDTNIAQIRLPLQSHSVSLQSQIEVPREVIGSVSYLPNHQIESNPHFSGPPVSIIRQNQPNTPRNLGISINSNVIPVMRQPAPLQHAVRSCVTQKTDSTNTSSSGVTIQNISNILNTPNTHYPGPQNVGLSTQVTVKPSHSQKNNPQLLQMSQTVFKEPPHSILHPVQNKTNPQNTDENDHANANIICLDTCNEATRSKAHECPVCAEIFDSFRLLDLHMYRLHPGMFLCPICGKSFKQRSTRNRHIVALHSSEKNFTCHMCNVAFTRTDTLKKHFNMHHPGVDIPKRPFSYSKGVAIQHQVPILHGDHQSHIYGEGVISPIQVTAALESSESSLLDIVTNSTNITNITPAVNNEVFIPADPNKNNDVAMQNSTATVHKLLDSQELINPQHNNIEIVGTGEKNVSQTVISNISTENVLDAIIHSNEVAQIKPIEIEQHEVQDGEKMSQQQVPNTVVDNKKEDSETNLVSCTHYNDLQELARSNISVDNLSKHSQVESININDQNNENETQILNPDEGNKVSCGTDLMSYSTDGERIVRDEEKTGNDPDTVTNSTLLNTCNPIEISDEDTNDQNNQGHTLE